MKSVKIRSLAIFVFTMIMIVSCKDRSREYYLLGSNQFYNNDYDNAIETFTKCIDLNDSNYKYSAYLMRSECYMVKEKHLLALNDIDTIIKYNKTPDSANYTYYFYRSQIYAKLKKYPEALIDINKTIYYSRISLFYKGQSMLYRAKYKYEMGDFVGARTDSIIGQRWSVKENKSFKDAIIGLKK